MKTHDKIKKLLEYSLKEEFKCDRDKFFEFYLKQLGKHIPELKDLKANKNSKLKDEVADVFIIGCILSLIEGVDDKTILKRVQRFREHIDNKLKEKV